MTIFIVAVLIAAFQVEPAAPFGLRMGMAKGELDIEREIQPYRFSLKSVPSPHPKLQNYLAEVTPKAGVCLVGSFTGEIKTSVYGAELRSEFDQLRQQLELVYGKGNLIDRLNAGSIWSDPQDWMQALSRRERTLMVGWDRPGGSRLKPELERILLSAAALSSNTGIITVQYIFTNNDACRKEAALAQSQSL